MLPLTSDLLAPLGLQGKEEEEAAKGGSLGAGRLRRGSSPAQ